MVEVVVSQLRLGGGRHARYCQGCGKPLHYKNRSGFCQSCSGRCFVELVNRRRKEKKGVLGKE